MRCGTVSGSQNFVTFFTQAPGDIPQNDSFVFDN
jgi:hypothetical protein